MYRFLIIVVTIFLAATSAHADAIGIFSDAQGGDCHLLNIKPYPELNTLYVFHKYNAYGTLASHFKIHNESNLFFFGAIFTPQFLVVGTLFTDLAVAYGSCISGDFEIAQMNFLWFGVPLEGCNFLQVVAAPTSPVPNEIAVVNCEFNVQAAYAFPPAIIGPESEGCRACCLPDICRPLPTAQTTWGAVKALYR